MTEAENLRPRVEALMKRCQIGVGGRNALDQAHDIMAECYGMLGMLLLRLEKVGETSQDQDSEGCPCR